MMVFASSAAEKTETGSADQPAALPAGAHVFEGTFRRTNQNNDQPLKMTLLPAGADGWKAVFEFSWKRSAKKWDSTWSGDPRGGDVAGTAANDKGNASYHFEGKIVDGELTMEHWKMNKDRKGAKTGTAVLKRIASSATKTGLTDG
jgi:hypothetical protein